MLSTNPHRVLYQAPMHSTVYASCRRALLCALLLLAPVAVRAGSATWDANPGSGEWDSAVNWTPQTVPTNPGDVATFGKSEIIYLSLVSPLEDTAIVFNPGARTYTINGIQGAIARGVTNNSGELQTFDISKDLVFDSGSAGKNTAYTVTGQNVELIFTRHASAGESTITTLDGGEAVFFNNSTAGKSAITCTGSGAIQFLNYASAGSATLTAQEGQIEFSDASDGARARIILKKPGQLNIYTPRHDNSPPTIGSLEGQGNVTLGRSLNVGSNGRNTSFSGQLISATSEIMTKTGTGTLHLVSPEPSLGGVTVSAGTLSVENTTGSATGPNPVAVNAGTLGGTGILAGTVTVGTGGGTGALIAPAHTTGTTATLTIQNTLTFEADGNYQCLLDTTTPAADDIVATGATIASGALFNLVTQGTGTLAQGASFTILDNTGADPIAGTFANLPDGAILTVNGQHLAASYEGGDGNDLTLTVVP